MEIGTIAMMLGLGKTTYDLSSTLRQLFAPEDASKTGVGNLIDPLIDVASLATGYAGRNVPSAGKKVLNYLKGVSQAQTGLNLIESGASGTHAVGIENMDQSVISEMADIPKTAQKFSTPKLNLLHGLGFNNDLFPAEQINNRNSVFENTRNVITALQDPEAPPPTINDKSPSMQSLLDVDTSSYSPVEENQRMLSGFANFNTLVNDRPEKLNSRDMADIAMKTTSPVLEHANNFKTHRDALLAQSMYPFFDKKQTIGSFNIDSAMKYIANIPDSTVLDEVSNVFKDRLPVGKIAENSISKHIAFANKSLREFNPEKPEVVKDINGLFDLTNPETANLKFTQLYNIADDVGGDPTLRNLLTRYKDLHAMKGLTNNMPNAQSVSNLNALKFASIRNNTQNLNIGDGTGSLIKSSAYINSTSRALHESIVDRNQYNNGIIGNIPMTDYDAMKDLIPDLTADVFSMERIIDDSSKLLRNVSTPYLINRLKTMKKDKVKYLLDNILWKKQ